MLEISEVILKESSYYKYLVEKGEAIGEASMARLMLIDALNVRFGVLPAWVEARLAEAGTDILRQWFRRSQSAHDIESVFS